MSNSGEGNQQCRATKKNGSQCQARATASGYCFGHDPSAAANRAKGGRNRSNAARVLRHLPSRLRPVADILQQGILDVRDGGMKPAQLQAMASGATALIKLVQMGELEERVRDLEKMAMATAS